MKHLHRAIAGVLAATAVASGSALAQQRYDAPPRYDESPPRYVQANPANFGVIEAIDAESTGSSGGNRAAGTILGGVVGGVLGHQFGSGRGNDAATIAGALGGAAVGHELAENRSGGRTTGYRVRVRLDTGDTRTYWQDNLNGLAVGDRVQVDNDRLFRSSGGAGRYQDRTSHYRYDDRGPQYRYEERTPQYDSNSRYYRSSEQRSAPTLGYYGAPPAPELREYHYDAQGYRVDQWGNRYDHEGYWVDERGIRHEYQDPPLPSASRPPQQ